MKFGVFYKWLISLILSFSIIIAFILGVVNWSFKHSFIFYTRNNEVAKVKTIGEILSKEYKQTGSWIFLKNNPSQWFRLLESAGMVVPPLMRQQLSPSDVVLSDNGPPPRTEPDLITASVPLAHRIALVDSHWKWVIGPRIPINKEHWYSVHSDGILVGRLGLQPIEIANDQLTHNFIEQQQTNLIWISLASLLLALIVATVWAQWFLHPIQRVMTAARQLAAGHYHVNVPVNGHNELSELAINFNQLASTLARNEQLRRQWIADISHELRTPIAIIGGEVEAILDGVRQATPERMTALHNEIGALGKLVDDLHLLSLADQASLKLTKTEVNFYELIEKQLTYFESRMEQQNLKLTFNATTEDYFYLRADARRLSQLLSNLLENSLRYTSPNGEVHLQLRGGKKDFSFEIQDTPPGVVVEEHEKIFDRLYRVDKSRSRAFGGSGLGLAICREIVLAHGGNIYAENSPLGGLSIKIKLPR